MRVLGLMSGTSVDAVDVAVCDFAPDPDTRAGLVVCFQGYREIPFPPDLRQQVLDLFRTQRAPLDGLTELNFSLGRLFAQAAIDGAASLGLGMADIDLIASHGQTIYHLVEPGRRATLQMGEPALIAAETGRTVVANFRAADMAAGGEGAPLVPFFDALFFGTTSAIRAVQNIGGIANVTFVARDEVWAFDIGPGNVLIDFGARHFSGGAARFDRHGTMASAGRADPELLAEVLDHPYFARPPPKTTGRELFGDAFAASLIRGAEQRGLSPADTMATLTAVTAESIARAYREFGPPRIGEIVLAGGGARNPELVRQIEQRLPGIRISPHDAFGIPSEAKEAVAFALLGYEALHGRPGNLPRCTGAARSAILGQITPGDNYLDLMRRVREGTERWDQTRSLSLVD